MALSTKTAALLTAVVAVGTYVTTQTVLALPAYAVVLAEAVVVGITAFVTAEET
jgi:hypothetical protein